MSSSNVEVVGLQAENRRLRSRLARLQPIVDRQGRDLTHLILAAGTDVESVNALLSAYDSDWFIGARKTYSSDVLRSIASALLQLSEPYPFLNDVHVRDAIREIDQ